MHFMKEMHERLTWARETSGLETAAAAAEALGVDYPTYAGHENGHRGFKRPSAVAYARKFRVDLQWLLTGRGAPRKDMPRLAHADHYIGAGAEVRPFDDHVKGTDLAEVEIPAGVPDDAIVAVVDGDSMYPRYFVGETLFYEQTGVHPSELVNQECAVKLADGRIFVKILRSGSAKNLFNLESWNSNTPMMVDQVLEWAAPVLARVNRLSRPSVGSADHGNADSAKH